MMKKILLTLPIVCLMATGCTDRHVYSPATGGVAVGYKSGKATATDEKSNTPSVRPIPYQPEGIIPKATAFQMTGDYADNVAITIDKNGNLLYFPAPSDINISSKPIDLGNGWWLNCQGISPNSVFTTYTFEEYMNLPSAPSPSELKKAVIPGAAVKKMVELPCNINEADNNIEALKSYLQSNYTTIK